MNKHGLYTKSKANKEAVREVNEWMGQKRIPYHQITIDMSVSLALISFVMFYVFYVL